MPQNKLLRVTQIDAIYLNSELENVFLNQVQNCLKFIPAGYFFNFNNEIKHSIKLLLSAYSLIHHECTFGQKMLMIKYVNLSTSKKYIYILLNFLDYFQDKIEDIRRDSLIYKCGKYIVSSVKFLSFINFCLFLKYGKYPLLIDRILNLKQEYCRDFVQRQFGYSKFLARELLWNGFIEILIYIIPLINVHKISRLSRKYFPSRKKSSDFSSNDNRFSVDTKCASCGEVPVLPHHMNCNHIFCYICLKGNLQADSGYECPKCYHKNVKEVCTKVVM